MTRKDVLGDWSVTRWLWALASIPATVLVLAAIVYVLPAP